MRTYGKRRRLTPDERRDRDNEALFRVNQSLSVANYVTVIAEFEARGIADARPKENVYTYNAWRALGRQVRKGEHGVKLAVWYPIDDSKAEPLSDGSKPKRLRCVNSTVFHISQTDPIGQTAAPASTTLIVA